jgi:hypothetical protein
MRLTFSNGFLGLLAALFMLSVCPSTPAQEPQIDALADHRRSKPFKDGDSNPQSAPTESLRPLGQTLK